MARLLLVMGVLVAVAALCTAASAPPAQRAEADLATQVKTLREEVRLLKARITELEKQTSEVHSTLGKAVVLPGASEAIVLPPGIQLPAQVLPPKCDGLPWNYDTGLYVFPGLDAPGGTSKRRK